MSTNTLGLRLRDANGALERLLGLLRRRGVRVTDLSVGRVAEDVLEVSLTYGSPGMTPERVRAELSGLVDVIAVQPTGSPGAFIPADAGSTPSSQGVKGK